MNRIHMILTAIREAWQGASARRCIGAGMLRLALPAATVAAAIICALQAPARLHAQEEAVDRVVAVVGDSIVLMSQLLQFEQQRQAMGESLPAEGSAERDEMRATLLDLLIRQQIILQAAIRDTLLVIDDQRVEEMLEQRITQIEQGIGGRAAMDRELDAQGLTMQAYRDLTRSEISQGMLVELYTQRHRGDGAVEVTDAEVRTAFEEGRDVLQERPATVTFRQILLPVEASDSTRGEARTQAAELLERVRAGEDFATLATEYSQDPGSAAAGGDLGWFRRGFMVDEFEEAAFSLLEGEVSEIVETEFGFHIIMVERIRFAERRARHILVRPEVGPRDIGRTRTQATEVADRARGEDFEELIDLYHDPSLPDSATVPQRQVAQILAPAYVAALTGRTEGEIVGPIQFTLDSRELFAVIRIVELREAGAFSFEDLEPQIRASLIAEKRERALLDELRAKTWVEIRDPALRGR